MIVGARFLGSASCAANAGEFALSEIGFLGRSNVGKSSLINALTNQKQLAKSSATPGKTRLINFFEVEFRLNLGEISAENLNFDENLGEFSRGGENLNLGENSLNSSGENLNLNENLGKNSHLHENSNANLQNQKSEKFKLIFIDFPGFGYARISHTQRQEWDKNLNEFLKQRNSLKLLVHLRDARHENLQIDEQINAYLQGILSPSQKLLAVFTKADKLNQAQKARLLKAFPNALLVSSAKKMGLERLENALIAHALGFETTPPTKNALNFENLPTKAAPTKHELGLKNKPTKHALKLKNTPTKTTLKFKNSPTPHKIGL